MKRRCFQVRSECAKWKSRQKKRKQKEVIAWHKITGLKKKDEMFLLL